MRRLSKSKHLIALSITAIAVISSSAIAYGKDVAFTQEDRDRLRNMELKIERLEEGLKAVNQRIDGLEKSVNQRIDDTNKRIDELKDGQKVLEGRIDTLIYAVMGCFIAFIGIVVWDRRTAISPAIKKNKELEEREDKMEKALKEYARKEPKLAEVLKEVGLL